jgi:hypothetical protein
LTAFSSLIEALGKGLLQMKRERMVILTSYVQRESYGLLGPQLAASIIQENTIHDCIVVTVTREDDRNTLKKALYDYFGDRRPVMGFSYLAGRTDLFSLARDLKEEGAFTILAGPQADVDFAGEKGWQDHPHYFQGLSSCFSMAMHGPAERVLPFLNRPIDQRTHSDPGLLNASSTWNEEFLTEVRWNNLYRLGSGTLIPLPVTTGQVLQQIGCPHASQTRTIEVDYPVALKRNEKDKVALSLKGCSFCDVAIDKGFHGALSLDAVLQQVHRLPEGEDGRKIPFELINENAIPGLPALLVGVREKGIRLSQVNLTLRADWFVLGEKALREALALAGALDVRVLLGSMGFESFDDRILSNLHKGLDAETNLRAVKLMRDLKNEFPRHWAYSRQEGAIHGFIHPTPWDSPETESNNRRLIALYGLLNDILPDRSVPLIIHHASALGDWAREIEKRENVQFKREGSTIGWWQVGERFII